MKNKIKFLLVLISISLVFVLTSQTVVFAADDATWTTQYSGSCGKNNTSKATWKMMKATNPQIVNNVQDYNRLVISGTGEMDDYNQASNGSTNSPYYNLIWDTNSIIVENGITRIGNNAFLGAEWVCYVSLPETLQSIGSYAFCGALKYVYELSIPDATSSIGAYAFYNSSIKELTLGNFIASIPEGAFGSCKSLKTVYIPKSVTQIDNYAFDYCTSLKDIYYEGTAEEWENISIGYGNNYLLNANVHFPKVNVTGIELNTTSKTLFVGSTYSLTASVYPNNADNKTVTWKSSNTRVASVSNGIVTAVSPGTATITATTVDGNKTATCSISVQNVAVDSISLNKSSTTIHIGKNETLIATLSPANATNKNVTWQSSNTNVASVSNGLITAKAAGVSTITATTTDGAKSYSCVVTVTDHIYSGEWITNSTYHWHICSINGCDQADTKLTHQYRNNCDTTCDCGYVRTVSHDYTRLEKDATEHWYVCSVCNAEKPNSRISHSGGRASCMTLAICSTCQCEYGTFAQHPYGTTWEYKAADGHARVCTTTNCNEHDGIIPHTPNIPSATEHQAQVCTACGYQISAPLNHSHSPATEWNYNATHHWNACSGCAVHLNETTHVFKNDCDAVCNCGYTRVAPHHYSKLEKGAAEHWYVCAVCNAEKPNSRSSHIGGTATCTTHAICSICQCEYGTLAQHPYEATYEYKTADGHAHICTTPNCAKHDEIMPHTPNIPAATEQQAQICTACGYQLSAPLNHSHSPATEWNYNATHHWNACGGCAAQLNEGTHEPGAEATTTTAQTCTICGYEIAPALGNEEIQVPTDSTDATTPTNSTESTDATTPTVPTDKTDPEDGSFPSWIVIVVVIGGVVIVVAIKKKRFAHKRN